jgi:taurine dioxygenase
MNVKMIAGALGAEISGIDLKDTSLENFEKINKLFLEHKVLFFRNQNITIEEQLSLGKHFGPSEKHPYIKGLDKYPEIVRIIKTADKENQWGDGWHSDYSYNVKPTKALILRFIKVPPVGGDTCFSNMELAWEKLNKKIQKKIIDKKAIHTSFNQPFYTDDYGAMESNGNHKEYKNEHPIVRTHPETGKKILFVNWMYTQEIVGLEKKESNEILKKIFDHQAKLEFTCRFTWTENTVCILDNRSVVHFAIGDFYPGRGLGYERIMDRLSIQGDQPY